MAKMGRPTIYTKELATEICGHIATTTMGLNDIALIDGIPDQTTISLWIRDEKKVDPEDELEEDFSLLYARAKKNQMHMLGEEMLEIADDASNDYMLRAGRDEDSPGWQENGDTTARSRLRLDTRKWLMSKLEPKVYGDKQQIDHTSKGEKIQSVQAATTAELEAIIAGSKK